MSNKLVFELVQENKINYTEDGFYTVNEGIWLKANTDGMNVYLTYMGNTIEDLNLKAVLDMIHPTNIHSLIYSNLSDIETEEIYSIYKMSSEYYLKLGETEFTINSLTKEEESEYISKFKADVLDAVQKHGNENVCIEFNWDIYQYTIECDSSYDSYAMDIISKKDIMELVEELGCNYSD